jgi:hypothetical protein
MKYLITWIVGVIVGAQLAAALVYFNPLTNTGDPRRGFDSLSLAYEYPGASVVALSHDGQLKLPSIPADVEPLWESGIAGMLLGVLDLVGDDGVTHAVASRVSVPSPRTDLVLDGVVVEDLWLVSIPGQGSLFVESEGNYWPLFKEVILPVGYLGQPWQGPKDYRPTRGPDVDGSAEVYGATGAFAGRTGVAAERLRLERYSASSPSRSTSRPRSTSPARSPNSRRLGLPRLVQPLGGSASRAAAPAHRDPISRRSRADASHPHAR